MSGVALFQLAVLVLCVAVTLTSLIAYQWRRYQAKRAAANRRQLDTPIRQLEGWEQEILAPWLKDPARPQRELSLQDHNVYRLEGDFSLHGVRAHGQETFHYHIAGVEVILPLDAADHVGILNSAEVVYAGRYAVVITLNGTFDLRGAQERDQRRQAKQTQWESGSSGRLKPIYDDDNQEGPGGRVDILGQRSETAAETEAREGRGYGVIAAVAWIGAFIALATSASVETELVRHGALAVAGLLAAVGLWIFWRPYRAGAPDRVNRVRGPLYTLPEDLAHQHSNYPVGMALGDNLSFTVPRHWFESLPYRDGERVEAEVRVQDQSAVRLGTHYSVESEHRRLPPVYWGKHLAVSLPALGALVLTLLAVSDIDINLQDDLHLTQAWLSNQTPSQYANGQALLDAPPGIGGLVQLSGKAHCQVTERPNRPRNRFHLDCHHLRLDPDLPELNTAPLPRQAIEFTETEQLEHRSLTYREQLFVGGRSGTGLREIRVATNPLEVVRTIDQFCMDVESNDSDIGRRCNTVKTSILETVRLNTDAAHDSWDEISALAEEALTDDEASVPGFLIRRDINRLHREISNLGERAIAQHRRELAERVYNAQSGGVTVEVRNADHDDLIPDPGSLQDEYTYWHALRKLATSDGAQPFSISGMLIDANAGEDGTPHYIIDGSRTLDNAWPAMMRSLLLVTATTLLAVHLPLLIIRYLGARRRTAGLRNLRD
ncbi:IgaA/UmoB family intracellular growth attenuator [Aquisalimonas asiatica]|uniref:Intracellular growth attenuator protein IgaA n=1 Tax=Aquisalimonas asiatica TaxID=406100 RepID=A0A1H8VSN5_9GAMM|nr:IgaA/UmoB family intracellular growth attenuator [Aquisalimonas asiatica]SEP18375.1 Intracellular growth attenuator protein IgaA [Aquisalimonas asiatica]